MGDPYACDAAGLARLDRSQPLGRRLLVGLVSALAVLGLWYGTATPSLAAKRTGSKICVSPTPFGVVRGVSTVDQALRGPGGSYTFIYTSGGDRTRHATDSQGNSVSGGGTWKVSSSGTISLASGSCVSSG